MFQYFIILLTDQVMNKGLMPEGKNHTHEVYTPLDLKPLSP